MYFLITIDTEGDNQWSEISRRSISTENAKYLPRFQDLCEQYGFKPTYLTSYEMTRDANFVAFAKSCLKKNTCEIGAHPHGWLCPPEYNLTGDDPRYAPYLMEYPEEILFKKMKSLKENLESTFDTQVVSHRSGRWAFDKIHAKVLDSLGFKVDCSVTPYVSWARLLGDPKGYGGSDYTRFMTKPYFIDLEDISKAGGSHLLEVPMTIRKNCVPLIKDIYSSLKKSKIKQAGKFLFSDRILWFRPAKENINDILTLLNKSMQDGDDYIMFMLHSSEFMPGANPVFVTSEEIERLFLDMNRIFKFLGKSEVKPVTCREYYKIIQEECR